MHNRMIEKRLVHNKSQSKPRAKGVGKAKTLFDTNTGKKAPAGAAKSEQYITFNTYMKRHVTDSLITRRTYVNAKTGEPADGITKETHKCGQHTTLYNWLAKQKNAEFSKILAEGGDLPPAPIKKGHNQQYPASQAAARRKTARQPTSSIVALPIQYSLKSITLFNIDTGKPAPAGTSQSKQNITFRAYVYRHVKATNIIRTTYVNAKTGEPAPGITKETYQPSEHVTRYAWLARQKCKEFSKILEDGGDLPPILPRTNSMQKNAAAAAKRKAALPPPFPSKRDKQQKAQAITERGANLLLTLSTPVPPMAEASSTADDHPSPLNKTPSAASHVSVPSLPPTSHPLPTPPLDTPFSLNPSQKRKPNFHSFFQPDDKDHAGHASRKAKTMPSDGSAEHPLPETDTLDSTSAESFTLSPPAKTPSF